MEYSTASSPTKRPFSALAVLLAPHALHHEVADLVRDVTQHGVKFPHSRYNLVLLPSRRLRGTCRPRMKIALTLAALRSVRIPSHEKRGRGLILGVYAWD